MNAELIKRRWNGFYAVEIYLPFSNLGRRFRGFSRELRGKTCGSTQPTTLPQCSWKDLLPDRPTRLVEAEKTDGNVNLAELGVIAKAAAGVEPGDLIVEIGTFDGRSTLNLAINSPAQCELFTLDLPPELPTHSRLEAEERKYVEKPYPGARFVNDPGKQEPATRKIHQLLGDSFVFDWSRYCGKAGLVFVDGSHAYEYVLKDSESALKLVRNGGCILWHDYGVWKGVTKGLEELEQRAKLGLTHVRGTSLVFART